MYSKIFGAWKIFTLSLGFSLLFIHGAMAREKCDCTAIAGLWNQVDPETQVSTFVNIPASCKGVQITQNPNQNEDWDLITDRVLCVKGKFRMQYRYRKDYLDEKGMKADYPLSKKVARALQGDVHQYRDGALSFGIDLFDQFCMKRDGKPCETGHFNKIPESELPQSWYE